MKKTTSKSSIFKIICLVLYIVCATVLIIESCMDGASSSQQSNSVGNSLADIFNDLKGDQTVSIKPESLTIENKIEKANVGDKYQIISKTLPEDSTYQSTLFFSSNENIATISNNGLISFLKQGNVTITIQNDTYKTILDSMNIEVNNIEAISINSVINNASFDKENNIYHIHLDNKEYIINSVIQPSNTTFKELSYTCDSNSYIDVSQTGKITPKSYSNNKVTKIIVSLGSISEEINVVVDIDIINLISITTSISENNIYPTQVVKPEVLFTPSDATFKSYQLISSDPSVVAISSLSYKGVKEGNAIVTIKSLSDESIYTTINVNVLPSPTLSNFSYSFNENIFVGSKSKINITNVTPKYATTSSIRYESLDTSIASVDNSGNVKAISVGNTSIKIYDANNIFKDKYINVSVLARPADDYTIDFVITYLKEETPYIYVNSEIDLKEYFVVNEFISEEGYQTTNNKEITYSLDSYSSSKAIISNGILKPISSGIINVVLTHNASKTTKIVSICAVDDFNISLSSDYVYVNNNVQVNIEDHLDPLQTYMVSLQNPTIANLTYIDNHTYTITPNYNGQIDIVVTPYYDNVICNELSKMISINALHIYTSKLDSYLFDANNSEEIVPTDNEYIIYINDNIYIKPIIDSNTTACNIEYSSDDDNILSIKSDGNLTLKQIGTTNITISDQYSNLSNIITVKVINKILIDEANSITFTGKDASYDESSNTYSLTNGHSGKIILNFLKESTYNSITYTTDNDKIISVGQDGTLTPISSGITTITLTCDDGQSTPIVISINIEVKRQNIIKDLDDFLLKVRKSLGHFGAFVVLGIFSTLTYLLFFNKKKMLFSIPLNFFAGFVIAATTEIIQLYVPGRTGAWADVEIDMSGFLISSVTITIIIVTKYFINLIKEKHKIKAAKQ